MCFHLYYFYNVSPSKISNHNALCIMTKWIEIDSLDITSPSPEAVTLIEENDNEVFKLLNY